MRLVPKLIWDLATVLSQDDWVETWKHVARRCPSDWLVQFCGVAMLTRGGRRDSADGLRDSRSLDSRRVQSMLSLGVLVWHLAEYDPAGDPHYPFVIRGLPYGAYQHLVAYWEEFVDGARLHVPGSTTLFGTHVPGGRFEHGECGYITSWKQAGIAKTSQPNGFAAAPGMAGKWRKNEKGDWERWSFVEMRLRISAPGREPVPMGPPPPEPLWRRPPPEPATGELDALVDELERSWYTDEEPVVDATPVELPAECGAARVTASTTGEREALASVAPFWLGRAAADAADVSDVAAVPAVDERSALEAASAGPRAVLDWLRKRNRGASAVTSGDAPSTESNYRDDGDATTLSDAASIDPDAFRAEPAAKFLNLMRAYDTEKQKREWQREQQRKWKPPG